jgi:hypothetical protein
MTPLSDIRAQVRQLDIQKRRTDAAETKLHGLIRDALADGISATSIAEAAGLSRQRVYQIRDGRR